jgi:hypothetical protein
LHFRPIRIASNAHHAQKWILKKWQFEVESELGNWDHKCPWLWIRVGQFSFEVKAYIISYIKCFPTEHVQILCSTNPFTVVEVKSPFYWSELVWRFSHLAGHLQYENLILHNPKLNFRNPIHSTPHELHYETWDPLHTCRTPILARSKSRVLNPKVVVILGSTLWSEHTREMFAPLQVPVSFFFCVNFMMYPKCWCFKTRSNQIWREAK